MDTAYGTAPNAAEVQLMLVGVAGLPEEPMLDDLSDFPDEFDETSRWDFGIPE